MSPSTRPQPTRFLCIQPQQLPPETLEKRADWISYTLLSGSCGRQIPGASSLSQETTTANSCKLHSTVNQSRGPAVLIGPFNRHVEGQLVPRAYRYTSMWRRHRSNDIWINDNTVITDYQRLSPCIAPPIDMSKFPISVLASSQCSPLLLERTASSVTGRAATDQIWNVECLESEISGSSEEKRKDQPS